MAVPSEWPPDVVDRYTPIRTLGKGGFASVVLAREKQKPNQLVAIKVVGNANKRELTYAHREIDILQELSAEGPHPNIMQVLHYWEASSDARNCDGHITRSGVLALTYVKGPTVESLLQYGGALSTVFGRVVAAQAMDAIAYLHYHAVIHR
jgi:serine/threonine protein kinase